MPKTAATAHAFIKLPFLVILRISHTKLPIVDNQIPQSNSLSSFIKESTFIAKFGYF